MLMKSFVPLALVFVASSCLAVDDRTARLNAENAYKFASQGKYEKAFTEIGWLLRDNSQAIRMYGEDVLKAHPAIANVRLQSLSVLQLTEMACDDGLVSAKQSADDILATVGRFADKQVAADARTRVAEVYGSADVVDQVEKCEQAKDAIKANELLAETLREAEEQKRLGLLAEEATKTAPARLRSLDISSFCAYYGAVLRGNAPNDYVNVKNAARLFATEAKRRGVSVNKDLVLSERIRIGINQCTLFASWGYPDDVNRTVGAWGTHSQLVYGQFGPYVYLENGVVRSFQD